MTTTADKTVAKPSAQTILLAAVVVASCGLVGYLLVFHGPAAAAPDRASAAAGKALTLKDIPFDGAQAFEYLNEICALGSRTSASRGMHAQQQLLSDYFKKLGGKVRLQNFRIRDPRNGRPVAMANLIVEWHPDRRERILLCTHYDTRPFPDQDPRNPRGTFLGANDGASGVAVLMELARHVAKLPGKVGVDYVFFDGEEYVFAEGDPYFIGSEYFATSHAAQPAAHYRAAVLLDMVGDADLQIYPDRHTMSWDDSRPLVESIWGTARRLGVSEFVIERRFDVLDDHLKLHNIAGIPSCDIIDFRFPAWHTERDTPESCSPLSLAKVGWVLQEWLDAAVK
jgi:hypothetical protein